jgi:hypothetical protein
MRQGTPAKASSTSSTRTTTLDALLSQIRDPIITTSSASTPVTEWVPSIDGESSIEFFLQEALDLPDVDDYEYNLDMSGNTDGTEDDEYDFDMSRKNSDATEPPHN